jgi:3-phenylpropionate/trans-cinnamate dioxygenase ferredoxin reductase subunit
MSTETHVIVGAGLAGATAAATLREEGFRGRVVLLGAEPHLPYERPPLSKEFLHGRKTFEDAFVHPVEFYDNREIELRLGAPVTGLDLDAHQVIVGHETLGYHRLLLATGSSARRLPPADRSGATVAYLRTVEDAERIKAGLRPERRVTVIGGGWIGLEVAAAARNAGCDVVVVEPMAEPLLRVLGPEVGRIFAALHRRHGVEVKTSTNVVDIRSRPASGSPGEGVPAVVHLDDGTATVTDLLVVGIGAVPNTDLAEAAGLKVEDGVVVDEHLRSSHPDVFAAGDLASAWHPALGRRVRVEHWDNAIKQGTTAARNMLGAVEAYDRLPYFFTDQYDLGMEYVGHVGPEGYDEVVLRGDPAGVFTAFWVTGGRIAAAMHVNDWDATPSLRAVVGADRVDLAALRDPRVPLDQVVAPTG